MAKQGWFILTDDQFNILNAFELGYLVEEVDGYNCVSDWYAIVAQLEDMFYAAYEDEDPNNDPTDEQFDIIYSQIQYMYYSSEAHTWFPPETD